MQPREPQAALPHPPTLVFTGATYAPPPHSPQVAPPQLFANVTPSWTMQDARNNQNVPANLAVQPAANPGGLKLKKKVVKMVGSAGALNNVPRPTPTLTATSSSLDFSSTTVKASPFMENPVLENSRQSGSCASGPSVTLTPTFQPALRSTEMPEPSKAEDSLDNIFACLMAPHTSALHGPEKTSSAISDRSNFSFESNLGEADVGKKILGGLVASTPSESVAAKRAGHATVASTQVTNHAPLESQNANISPGSKTSKALKIQTPSLSQEELEIEYMHKAVQYVNALPGNQGTTTYTFKLVTKKLCESYLPNTDIPPKAIEALRARYVFAVANYVQGLNKGVTRITTDAVKLILEKHDGDFLQLCAKLVEQEYIALENLDEIIGLCKTIINILPQPDPDVASSVLEIKAPHTAQSCKSFSSLSPQTFSQGPVKNMPEWPGQVKRENPASFRTCKLKGISQVKTIHQLQALVWGGKLEAISLPEGSDFGTVRFLTAEGCQKYYEATQNGIEILGENDKKMVVIVERTEGPNSTNDVMRACAEGDATRCVRTVGADDGWNDALLMKLAHGQDKIKRELDIIQRGQTSRGYNYIEFRFANIYHALSFKRELMNEEDWEHCTINYAPDPCEVACGVHYQDVD